MAEKIATFTNQIADEQDAKAMFQMMEAQLVETSQMRVLVNELKGWAETLAANLNADAGVTDTNYDATIAGADVTQSLE